MIGGYQALQILKESLDYFLSARLDNKGVPGEIFLSGLLDSSSYEVTNDVFISALRTPARRVL